jgi:hypothetical protein
VDGLINKFYLHIALHSNYILLHPRCYCNTLLIISADAKMKYRLYKVKRWENLLEAMMHINTQDVRCCPCFMDNVLEALIHSHKNHFTERWVYDHLLSFIGSFMQSFIDNIPERVESIFEHFSSFEEMCIHSVIQKLLEGNAEKEYICNKVLEKQLKNLYGERHLPSLFVNDLLRSITDAKIMATINRNKCF